MNKFDLIVAMDLDGAIGSSKSNSIPWHLPPDLAHFKEKTLGKTIVMGSKTWASLPVKPLPGRRNVVISKQEIGFVGADQQYSSLVEALQKEENVVVIGGGQIYAEAIDYGPSSIHMTVVDVKSKGDVQYPCDGSLMLEFGSYRYKEHTYVKMESKSDVHDKLKFTIMEWVKLPVPKLTTKYSYSVYSENGNGVRVILTETETGKTKEFVKANGSVEGYLAFMNSLTDELCESFFGSGKKKKGKKNV